MEIRRRRKIGVTRGCIITGSVSTRGITGWKTEVEKQEVDARALISRLAKAAQNEEDNEKEGRGLGMERSGSRSWSLSLSLLAFNASIIRGSIISPVRELLIFFQRLNH